VTNFEFVWTSIKVAEVENAKTCRLYPTLPYWCSEVYFFRGDSGCL